MKKTNLGILFGLSTYLCWGFLSLFWKLLAGVNAYNTLSYRILFTSLTMLVYMIFSGRSKVYKEELSNLFKNPKAALTMLFASLLISINWLVYIYAVGHGQATEASLGYYIMPLVSVGLSVIFLRESLNNAVRLAILVAGIGVLVLVINTGNLPLVSLALALSFGLYGLVKKSVSLSSDVAMLVESLIILPFALIYLLFFAKEGMQDYNSLENSLLVLSGAVTAIPLLFFAEALKRAPLNLIGFIQYINPTIQLAIAVLVFQEGITAGELKGFIFIWSAIAIFVIGQLLEMRKRSS